jgi:hypothetical protein
VAATRSRAKKDTAEADEFFETPAESVGGRKWEYEEGDVLAGIVVSTFEGDGDYGPYMGYVIEPNEKYTTEAGGDASAVSKDDPLVFYVNDNSAAARSVPRAGIEVGDKVRVQYEGLKPAKSGREFKSFNIKVEKAA